MVLDDGDVCAKPSSWSPPAIDWATRWNCSSVLASSRAGVFCGELRRKRFRKLRLKTDLGAQRRATVLVFPQPGESAKGGFESTTVDERGCVELRSSEDGPPAIFQLDGRLSGDQDFQNLLQQSADDLVLHHVSSTLLLYGGSGTGKTRLLHPAMSTVASGVGHGRVRSSASGGLHFVGLEIMEKINSLPGDQPAQQKLQVSCLPSRESCLK